MDAGREERLLPRPRPPADDASTSSSFRARAALRRSSSPRRDAAWINAIAPPHFLKDGSFVFLSERSGFFHLYRHAADGSVEERDHEGRLDGRRPVERRREGGRPSGSARRRRTRASARSIVAKLDGSSLTRVTTEPGVHTLLASPRRGAYFVDTFSNADDAAEDRRPLGLGRGRWRPWTTSRTRSPSSTPATVELGSFAGADGTLFYTRLVKPSDFDPSKKYPVVVYVYGGPHAQLVQDAWAPVLDRLPRLEGLPRLDDGRPRLLGTRARVRDAAPEEHGRAGAEGPARGRRGAQEAAVRRRRRGSGSRAGRTAAT